MFHELKIHVISDLYLGFNEFADDEHTIPDVDLVIINGNIGHTKRSMLYAETLCKKYPKIKFVYNMGELEAHTNRDEKGPNLLEKQTNLRKVASGFWPSNLYYETEPFILDFEDGRKVDIMCAYGWPNIVKFDGNWEDTYWYKNYTIGNLEYQIDMLDMEYKPKETSNVLHGSGRNFFRATPDYINECHNKECLKIKSWELRPTATKLLITHINPFIDTRFKNQYVKPYLIHLLGGYWVTSNTLTKDVNFLGATLFSNPGRNEARKIIHTIKLA